MQKSALIALQGLLILIGIAVVIALLLEPQLEGRNAHATLWQIYLQDPLLACVYLGSLPFFIGLTQLIRITEYAKRGQYYSLAVAQALRIGKYCAASTAVAIVAVDIGIAFVARTTNDDSAGALMLSLALVAVSILVAFVAESYERTVRKHIAKES